MPYKECTKCGNSKYEDDSNPNLHYQEPEKNFICHSCRQYESLKKGEWYQDSNGEYHQK